MNTTDHLGLRKPTDSEYGDVADINYNSDILDEEVYKRAKSVNGNLADEDGNIDVDEVPFAGDLTSADAQHSDAEFLYRTTGGDASLSDGPATLVSIQGRRTHTGIVQEELTMTVTPVAREEGEEEITATIDRDTFVAYVSASGTTTLTYTDAWSANPTLYGVTVTGTPVDGDTITIVYVKEDRGTITQSTPTAFRSTGWNLYNNTLGYARVKKYSNTYGFLVGGTYTKVEFSETVSGTKEEITPVSGYFMVPSDGYVWVTGGNTTDTYVLMTWSDWTSGYSGDFAAYTESTISISSVMSSYFANGLCQVAGVSDEINLNSGYAIVRIERMAYSAANLATVQATGRPYECDDNYIYAVKASAEAHAITISSAFTANDHGMEFVDGGSVAVFVQTLYGQNLKDKLRTDVVTKSQDIVDGLTSTATNKALSANQGKALKDITDTLNGQIANKFHNSQITSISDLTTHFATNKIAIVRVSTGVGNSLSGHNRQGIVLGFEISTEYDGFIFLDSNGDTYSGWITVATGAVTYHALQ